MSTNHLSMEPERNIKNTSGAELQRSKTYDRDIYHLRAAKAHLSIDLGVKLG